MIKFSLIEDGWLPVADDQGGKLINLTESFQPGTPNLNLPPQERIAITRLLVAIASAALSEPNLPFNPVNATEFKRALGKMPAACTAYLTKHKALFNLWDKKHPFLQIAELKSNKLVWASKLDISLATGDTSTLMDNAGQSQREFTPDRLAIMLVTYQNFALHGLIGSASWNGVTTGRSSDKPASGNWLHTFRVGTTLLETIHLNLIPKDMLGDVPWGRPVWEKMPKFGDKLNSHLACLVPISRCLLLDEDCRSVILANGVKVEVVRDPYSTQVAYHPSGKNAQAGDHPMQASLEESLWRQLPALLGYQRNGLAGAFCLRNQTQVPTMDIWVGGTKTLGKNAKIVATIDSTLSFPSSLTDVGGASAARYLSGLKEAEDICARLKKAIWEFFNKYANGSKAISPIAGATQSAASAAFWSQADRLFPRLIKLAVADTLSQREWNQPLFQNAAQIYRRVCTVTDSRGRKAFLHGLNVLNSKKKESNASATQSTAL